MMGLLVFLSALLVDAFWVLYIRRVSQGHPVTAGLYSSAVCFLGAFIVFSYVHDWKQIFPAALGAFIGTCLTVMYDKRRR